mmetsp:Transcript_14251/g.18137  ORF Transcript_14251/g.18137 Transcript_14251/m.18137 type:complete len:86 (+) Transcript_14251:101-358(+)
MVVLFLSYISSLAMLWCRSLGCFGEKQCNLVCVSWWFILAFCSYSLRFIWIIILGRGFCEWEELAYVRGVVEILNLSEFQAIFDE